MKLYHVPGSRSARVLWLLHELELPHELVVRSMADGSLRSPEHRAVHPLGHVPALEDGGQAFYESGAIVQYVLERHGQGRLEPAIEDPERGLYLQWFHWGEATLMPPIATLNGHRFVLPEQHRSAQAVELARKQLAKRLAVLDARLETRPHLLDQGFSAADVMVGYAATLARWVDELPARFPAVHAWLDGLTARPAYARAFRGGFGGDSSAPADRRDEATAG